MFPRTNLCFSCIGQERSIAFGYFFSYLYFPIKSVYRKVAISLVTVYINGYHTFDFLRVCLLGVIMTGTTRTFLIIFVLSFCPLLFVYFICFIDQIYKLLLQFTPWCVFSASQSNFCFDIFLIFEIDLSRFFTNNQVSLEIENWLPCEIGNHGRCLQVNTFKL